MGKSLLARIFLLSMLPSTIALATLGYSLHHHRETVLQVAISYCRDLAEEIAQRASEEGTTIPHGPMGRMGRRPPFIERGTRSPIPEVGPRQRMLLLHHRPTGFTLYLAPSFVKERLSPTDLLSDRTLLEGRTYRVDGRLWALARAEAGDVAAVVGFEIEDMMSPVIRYNRNLALVVLLFVGSSAVSLLALWRLVIRPLMRLAAEVRDFAEEGRLPSPSAGERGEISYLRWAIWDMARRTSEYLSYLEDYIGGLIRSKEEERNRISMELHDTVLQELTALYQRVEMALRRGAELPLSAISEELKRSIAQLREICMETKTPLVERGLEEALESLASYVSARHPGTTVEVEVEEGLEVGREVALSLYRIAQEALNNAIKHGRARRARVRVWREGEEVKLTVADDGVGFDVDEEILRRTTSGGKLGLSNMRERALMLGGRLSISSERGRGTTVTCAVPARPSPNRGSPSPPTDQRPT